MDGNFITTIRAGAVGAIAAKYLARKNSKVTVILGCGTQGRMQLTALKWVLPIRDLRCYDISLKNAEVVAKEMSSQDCAVTCVASPEDAVTGADVVVTTTRSDWIEPGMHISTMGGDTNRRNAACPGPSGKRGGMPNWGRLLQGKNRGEATIAK